MAEGSRMPVYENDAGEALQLEGRPIPVSVGGADEPTTSWVDKRHPFHSMWHESEQRMRASYVATRNALKEFLVPHRFEGDTQGGDLRRAQLGYGVRLNASWLSDIMGHIRGAPATYNWGPLSSGDEASLEPPEDGVARLMWEDATLSNMTWRNFHERKALEWLLSSPGGFILVDGPPEGSSGTADRPSLMFVPWSWVTDVGRSKTGFRYVRLIETQDNRDPKDAEDEDVDVRHVLFNLDPQGNATVERFDEDGVATETLLDLGRIEDRQGQAVLPLIPVKIGEHEDIEWVGAGLLQGLDDIVLDLYNLASEIREGFRDVSFGALAYAGPDGGQVQKALKDGSRFLDLGDNADTSRIERLAAESAEVQAGLLLLEAGLKAWAQSAQKKAAEAMERAEAASGVALKADFQLDIRPLLVEVTETLDSLETDVMFISGQIAGSEAAVLRDVGVSRGTEFQLEDEASRVARIVAEFTDHLGLVPSEFMAEIVMKWLEASGLVDMGKKVTTATGEDSTLGEILPERVLELARTQELGSRRRAEGAGLGLGLGGI